MDPSHSEFRSLPSEYESRDIFTAHLKGLAPNTEYAFAVEDQLANHNPDIYYFKTFDPNNYTILNGGDIGINPESKRINNNGLSGHRGDLIMIGGDISYDNNFPQWYRATDQILIDVPHAVANYTDVHTRLIPMIKAPGNHDFGVNSNNRISITHDEYEPLFKHYYPQNTHHGSTPNLSDRRSYFYHVIEPTTLIISLDSGYDTDFFGEQTEWLENVLRDHQHLPIKIVHYHEPIYPGWDYPRSEIEDLGRQYWVPLFDEYNVTVVFENHNHSLKRSYPLRNNTVSDTGTLYIGDGAWGAIDNPWTMATNGLIAEYQAANHVWEMNVDMNNEDQ